MKPGIRKWQNYVWNEPKNKRTAHSIACKRLPDNFKLPRTYTGGTRKRR